MRMRFRFYLLAYSIICQSWIGCKFVSYIFLFNISSNISTAGAPFCDGFLLNVGWKEYDVMIGVRWFLI